MQISIIIPVLNEQSAITTLIETLVSARTQGHEVIVVDGGSVDATLDVARGRVDVVLQSSAGRACQMNIGAQHAQGEVLWFVHADSVPALDATALIVDAIKRQDFAWGRFDVSLSGRQPLLRVIEKFMNLRSCWTGIATGDQGIFVRRDYFEAAGGFPQQLLMEDIALSKKLSVYGKPCCIERKLVTSSRRWETHGIVRTMALMWVMRLGYFCGISTDKLHAWYYK